MNPIHKELLDGLLSTNLTGSLRPRCQLAKSSWMAVYRQLVAVR